MKYKKGVSLIEVVIATSIISLTLVTLVTVYSLVAKFSLSNVRAFKATGLAEESVEVLGYLRDVSWSQNISPLTLGTTYRLYWDGTTWTATTTAPLIESRYDVTFVLTSVYRDSNFNVVSSGGTLDSGSRKAAVNISWRDGSATTTKAIETYIFNTFNN
ncbi:MAG: prepilin-type N-terminal cleavage/methylation domain-containing protein [Candidatus Paceibacterota bacterium]|jgi:hypothetical protein